MSAGAGMGVGMGMGTGVVPAGDGELDVDEGVGALASDLRLGVCRLRRRIASEREAQELSLTAAAVLGTLQRRGPQSIGQLAASEQVRAPSMTRTISRLEQAGHVTRRKQPEDGRAVVVHLTQEGEHRLASDQKAGDDWLAHHLSALSREDRAVLRAAAPILTRLSERHGEGESR